MLAMQTEEVRCGYLPGAKTRRQVLTLDYGIKPEETKEGAKRTGQRCICRPQKVNWQTLVPAEISNEKVAGLVKQLKSNSVLSVIKT